MVQIKYRASYNSNSKLNFIFKERQQILAKIQSINQFRRMDIQYLERENDQFMMSFAKNSNATIHDDHKYQKLHQKYVRFISDDEELISTQQDNKIHNLETIQSHKSKTNLTQSPINHQSTSHNNKFSPNMKNLLQNCKISIQSLQKQLEIKNQQLKKLQLENQTLNIKLKQTQKQVQRTHQILKMYINQSECKVKQFVTVNQSISNSQNQILLLKSEVNHHKTISEQTLRQNNILYQENHELKVQITKLNSQIIHLEQKVYKMGKGVGKALTTIKKNNHHFIQRSNFQLHNNPHSQNKNQQQNTRNNVNGKIVFKRLQFSTQNQFHFSTPLKKDKSVSSPDKKIASTIDHSISSKETFSTQKCQIKMKQISTHAQKIQQIDKLQLLLKKMQQISKSQDSSQEIQDQISKHHFQSQPLSFG